jgi:hypothetical protein
MIERDAAESYSAVFRVQFIGEKNWIYQLKILKSAAQKEISLHIEGVQSNQNPGDIRMVTDGVTSWMIGDGTDQQCVQFPNGQGMDPTFIYPESLISLEALKGSLALVGEEELNGFSVVRFHATGVSSGPWKDAAIELVQEKGSGMLRQFAMIASGDDPFFATGPGKMNASYNAGPLGNEVINPVEGCEISVPLPEGISMFVRLPGIASFESKSSIGDLVKYYQSTLPEQNWIEKEAPIQADAGAMLSYQRDAESVEIYIEPNPSGGSAVRLLFTEGQ